MLPNSMSHMGGSLTLQKDTCLPNIYTISHAFPISNSIQGHGYLPKNLQGWSEERASLVPCQALLSTLPHPHESLPNLKIDNWLRWGITLFRAITLLCGIDNVLWNIPSFKLKDGIFRITLVWLWIMLWVPMFGAWPWMFYEQTLYSLRPPIEVGVLLLLFAPM